MKTNEIGRRANEIARLAGEELETGWGRPFASAYEGCAVIIDALEGMSEWDKAAARHEEALWEAAKQSLYGEAASQAGGLRKCLYNMMKEAARAMAACEKFARERSEWE